MPMTSQKPSIPTGTGITTSFFGFGSQCLGKYVGMVLIPEMVRQAMLRDGIASKGKIKRPNGAS